MILIILFSLLLIECFLRGVDPIGVKYFSEASKYFSSMQQNDTYAYIHKPYYKAKLEGVDVSINSQGFRGPEFDSGNASGKERIIILGDSVVFGWGVPQGVIFPVRIQEILDPEKKNVEIVPIGVGSWNTRTEYEYLKSKGISFHPDIIVLVIVHNDLEPKDRGHTDIRKDVLFGKDQRKGFPEILRNAWGWIVDTSYIAGYIQYFLEEKMVGARMTRVTKDSPEWQDVRLALDEMVKLCRENNVELVPYIYTSADQVTGNPIFNLYYEHLKELGLRVFTLPDVLFVNRKYENSIVDRHLNADGQMIIAREMARNLNDLLVARHKMIISDHSK
ncbi:MAG TPA: hypothetical protein PLO85_00780 [Candidatus Omnitrophota bacterium]|nr:hypothetical protein [Candidatus Omnitrophota bacterium]